MLNVRPAQFAALVRLHRNHPHARLILLYTRTPTLCVKLRWEGGIKNRGRRAYAAIRPDGGTTFIARALR